MQVPDAGAFISVGGMFFTLVVTEIQFSRLQGADGIKIGGFVGNIVPAIRDSIAGRSCFVALACWVIHLRPPLGRRPDPRPLLKGKVRTHA